MLAGMAHEQRRPEHVSFYFRERAVPGGPAPIDDRTWADLGMDGVFASIDRTRSSVGQACLYDMLRRPLADGAELAAREEEVRSLLEDRRSHARLGQVLARLGVQREGEVFQFLAFMRTKVEDRTRWLYLCLSILAVLSIPAAIAFGMGGLVLLAAVMITNVVIHYRHKPVVAAESPTHEYLHRLLVAAHRLGRLEAAPLAEDRERLRALSRSLKGLRSRTAFMLSPSGVSGDIIGMMLEYVRLCFLLEVTTFFFVHNQVVQQMDDLIECYGLVGGVDALSSVAAFRRETPGLAVPEWVAAGLVLDAQDLVHPLLPHAVANSIRMDGKGVIVTGSNMSGKSTFLRTMGVNQILASTIGVAYAGGYRASPLFTVTSIIIRDDLAAAESHYYAEAKRLLHILAVARSGRQSLVIIDEILAGTNSEERIAASIRILRYLAATPCLVVAATHDRQIAAALEGCYANLHFTHRVEGEGLEFDYRLREGIVEAGNALKLLRIIGYPPEILDESG
jgi:hypothetical protein